jgi:alpha-L-rhamnosidase
MDKIKNRHPFSFWKNILALIWLVSFAAMDSDASGRLKVGYLTCEHLADPPVIDVLHPRLSWINEVSSDRVRGEGQTAYRICVASSEKLLKEGKADIWDTGKVLSQDSYLIAFKGKDLKSDCDYWWRVKVWDHEGKSSRWSKPGHWGMGLLSSSEWKARWIGAPWEGAAPLLRKDFKVKSHIVSAKVFISGLGYFELYLNGHRVGNDYLVPNFTDYTSREGLKTADLSIDDSFRSYRVMYLSYPITSLLKRGENTVGVILGNGFYDCQRHWVCSFGHPCLLCQLELTYSDGHRELVCSDETWKARPSAIVMNGVYDGEIYDANRETPGWSAPSCDDRSWQNVRLSKPPVGKLTAQMSPSDKIMERLHPVSFKRRSDGSYLVDFGKEISGWIHFLDIRGHQGDTLNVKYICESPLGVQKYIFKGDRKVSYAPRFTWYVFSKAIIKGVDRLSPKNLVAEAVNTDVKLTAQFSTSNQLFNQINTIWQRSQMDNMHGCIASDCPHRERSPYTGDGQVSCATVMDNFDAAAFYQKWIRDIRDTQNTKTGYVPNGAPWQPGCGGGVAWGAAMNIMPWEYYLHYGDLEMLKDNYFAMKEQVRYMLTWLTPDSTMLAKKTNLNSDKPNYWLNLGDWAPPFGLPPEELVHTFYLWRCASITAKAAKALHCSSDEQYYTEIAEKVKSAFNRKFYNPDTHSYGDFGSNIFALVLGVPEDRYRAVCTALRHEIADRYKGHLNTGMFGTKFFFNTLTDNGMNDLAYEAMNKTDFPSYGNWIRQGATTTWEQWNGQDSHNHPMFGGGLTWFYRKLAGVNVDENDPGYRHFYVCPVFTDSLNHVYYSNLTPYGKIVSEITRVSGGLEMNVRVPVGSSATVYLPSEDEQALSESGHPLSEVPQVQVKGIKNGFTVCDVRQGTYRFYIKKN